jgi:hypothetical protein
LHLQGTWTDGQTDRAIPIYPLPNFACGGYKKEKKKKDKTKNEKRKKEKKANKQNKQKTAPNIIIYIVPGVGLKDFIFFPKIVWKER